MYEQEGTETVIGTRNCDRQLRQGKKSRSRSTVALLRLLRKVVKSVKSVNRKEGVGRGEGSIITPREGVAIEAWW